MENPPPSSPSSTTFLPDLPFPNLAPHNIDPLFANLIASWSRKNPLDHPLSHPASSSVYLASRLVPDILPMAHAILRGATLSGQKSAMERKANGLSPAYPEPLPQLDAATEAQVRAKLREIAAHLSFDVSEEIQAACQPDSMTLLPTLPGYACKIWINPAQYTAIEQAVESGDSARFFYSLLALAVTLLHEVGHAICFAVEPGGKLCTGNGFLGPQAVCDEMGFEFESRLFGGVFGILTAPTASYYVNRCNCSRTRLLGKAGFSEWPDRFIIDSYHASGHQISVRRDASEEVVKWEIGLKWVAELFQERFWENASRGVDVRFPRLKRM
ncbi:hypothetical protein AC578_5212 [Pseudocercospora eumusae]|uniref:Uncharacterized protein n=1 Tax=Pseudocercospora eumusae TaxID=321146 RepID=A0A139H0H3_9PEZI|nr:hypothetical protein AC578_5212 [Pseudocercospora eumusae]